MSDSSQIIMQPDSPWQPGNQAVTLRTDPDIKGMSNSQNPYASMLSSRPDLDSEHQSMDAAVLGTIHKLGFTSATTTTDYYAVTGDMRHGIRRNIDLKGKTPTQYYAKTMTLELEVLTKGGLLYGFGPNATVGTTSRSWSIGGNLSTLLGAASGGGAGFNASISGSFSVPDVTAAPSPQQASVLWDIKLFQKTAHIPCPKLES